MHHAEATQGEKQAICRHGKWRLFSRQSGCFKNSPATSGFILHSLKKYPTRPKPYATPALQRLFWWVAILQTCDNL